MLPADLTIRRKAPGVYGVYKRVKPSSAAPTIVGVLLGPHDAHVGDVQRTSPTRWRSKSSRHGAEWSGAIYANRDAAATSLLQRPGEDPS